MLDDDHSGFITHYFAYPAYDEPMFPLGETSQELIKVPKVINIDVCRIDRVLSLWLILKICQCLSNYDKQISDSRNVKYFVIKSESCSRI